MLDCLKQVLCLKFESEPPYDYIFSCLNLCLEKVLQDDEPNRPLRIYDNSFLKQAYKNYDFEWNNTIGSRFRF